MLKGNKRVSAQLGEAMAQWVGTRIRMRRQSLGMSMARMAEQLGIGRQNVDKWERGETRVFVGQLYEVAQILDVDPGWFYRDFPVDNLPDNQAAELDLLFQLSDGVQVLLGYARLNEAERAAVMVLLASLGTGREPTIDGARPLAAPRPPLTTG
jgi:transcriptional regulator with XRE-family HTH domain